jgi:hypothetical protein
VDWARRPSSVETLQSTRVEGAPCAYLGVDVTDRFAAPPRAMDVCGLESRGGTLVAHFWTWSWGASIDPSPLLPEVAAARTVMLDGPQGLAHLGGRIRSCERSLAAAGKTADVRPPLTQPYGGFIASALDLFAAFRAAGLAVGSTALAEVYPAAMWARLARRLPTKRLPAGRQARAAILRALGVTLPETPLSHDQLDAGAAAVLGAAAEGRIRGMSVAAVGDPVFWDATEGCLREGVILVPELEPGLRARLEDTSRPWTLRRGTSPRAGRTSA